MTIVAFIVILAALILVHELGHFWTARAHGIDVEEFGIGFPPRITSWKRGATVYSLNWIPIGGFVKIRGEDGADEKNQKSFSSRSVGARISVIIAGVVMNVLFAGVLLSVGFMIGVPSGVSDSLGNSASVSDRRVRVARVADPSPAAEAGVVTGDVLLTINGQDITSVDDVHTIVDQRNGIPTEVRLQRLEGDTTVTITPRVLEGGDTPVLGVALADTGLVTYPWYASIWYGFATAFQMTWYIIVAFGTILKDLVVHHEVAGTIAGPVGLAVVTGQFVRLGIGYVIQFAAILSLNLAVLNILPIPALDGGRFLFLIIEKIRGKPVNKNAEQLSHTIGFAFMILLVIVITARDIGTFAGPIKEFFSSLF